jgi:hypothetical protein
MKSKETLKKQLKDLEPGALISVEWFDASVGKSFTGGSIDVPVKSWGIYIGVLGKRNKHIVLAQNNFQYADGFYDIDYTAIPVTWTVSLNIIDKNHVAAEEADLLLKSFLRGGRRILNEHKQQRLENHGSR